MRDHKIAVAELAGRVIRHALTRECCAARYTVGIAGPPGAGKSTLAESLRDFINSYVGRGVAEIAPMDGFHLTNRSLQESGSLARKGEPDTFDAAGYAALLKRLHDDRLGAPVQWPTFDRTLHDPTPGGVVFGEHTVIAITEGNYLLLESHGWQGVSGCLDEAWYLDAELDVVSRRLLERQLASGKSEEDAWSKVENSDLKNAALVAETKNRADLVLCQHEECYYRHSA